MADETGRLRCQARCWITGSIIGLVGIVISVLFGGLSVTGAIFVGVLIALALGVLLSVLLCKPLPPPMSAGSAPTAGRTKPAPPQSTAVPKPPSPASAPATASADPPVPSSGGAAPVDPAPEAAPERSAAAGAAMTGAAAPGPAAGGTAVHGGIGETPPAGATADTPAAESDQPTEADKPVMLDAPREGGADDLKQIKGVGPKLEKMLNSMGFYHFDQIAAWTGREIAWVDSNLDGFKGRATRDNWVGQARTLADGDSTAFSDRVRDGDVY